MKKKVTRLARSKLMRPRSPWRSLTRTVNRLIKADRTKKDPATYLEKAEMAQLKRSIGKLKTELKEAQKENLDLVHKVDELTRQLDSAASQLARVSDALKELSTSLGTPGAQ